jgi:PadR family transcriptional regulator PadR
MALSLSESAFWALTALAREPLHGYAILRSVEELSDGEMTLRVTTLYATLERLEHSGLVQVVAEEVVDGRARRTYAVTDRGRQVLAQEAGRLLARAQAARRGLRTAASNPLTSPVATATPSPALRTLRTLRTVRTVQA